MSKVDDYRHTLRHLEDWEPFLLQESGLPGPRGNLELARAVAEEGDEALFHRYRALDVGQAPTNDPREFLAFCGVLGLGRLLAERAEEGSPRQDLLAALRHHASDPRWRLREAVAQGLQWWGRVDMAGLLAEVDTWAQGGRLEQRAAAAAVCEPSLLLEAEYARPVFDLLDAITATIPDASDRRSDEFRALRQALGYCWSVAAVALPEEGLARMEAWFRSPDPDVQWILRQNLKKKRLARLDAAWVTRWRQKAEEA
jgi:hypothetical protein